MRLNSKKERDHAGEIIPDARGEAASQRFIGRQPLVAVMLCVRVSRGVAPPPRRPASRRGHTM